MVFAMTPFTLAQTFPLQEPLQELSCPCMLRIVNNFLWGSLLNNYATVDKDHAVSPVSYTHLTLPTSDLV